MAKNKAKKIRLIEFTALYLFQQTRKKDTKTK